MEIRPVKHSLLELLQNIMKTMPPRHPLPVESAAQSAADPVYTPDTEQTFIRANSAPAIAMSALNLGLRAVSDRMKGREHCQLPAVLSPRPAARLGPTLQYCSEVWRGQTRGPGVTATSHAENSLRK